MSSSISFTSNLQFSEYRSFQHNGFFFNVYLFILFIFLAVLGLCFCARPFSSCGERGPLFITVRGPLTVAGSLLAEHKQTCRLSSSGSRAQLLHGMWDLPRPGLEPVSPALAGRFSTTAPPGKPQHNVCNAHPCCSIYHFFPVNRQIIFHCMDTPHFIYPFISWWAFGLFSLFGYYK